MTNVVFFGTPMLSVPFLEALVLDPRFNVVLVVTQASKPKGRHGILEDSPVKSCAIKHGIPVFEGTTLKDAHAEEVLKTANADLFVVFAYGLIIPKVILSLAKNGAINVHPSKLPRHRGPSPMQWAILQQDTETAISIMLMDEKMDHGPILRSEPVSLSETITTPELEHIVMERGPSLLLETLDAYVAKNLTPVEQDHELATFCPLLKKTDGLIDWSATAKEINAKQRAFIPFPGTYTFFNNVQTKILETRLVDEPLPFKSVTTQNGRLLVGTGNGTLEILSLQPAGKKPMSAVDYIRGLRGELRITG